MNHDNDDYLMDQYDRQRPLGLTIPRSVSIVGCGGVGSWIAMYLALAGVPTLYLWDHDEVSETNLNRLPLGPAFVGHNKALAMRNMLAELKPKCDVVPIGERWTPEAQAGWPRTPEWIVACTDTWASRRAIFAWAQLCTICNREDHDNIDDNVVVHNRTPRAKYIEASAEGEFGGCTGEPAMFASDRETVGYASIPVWVGPCITSAYMVCAMILHNHQMSAMGLRLGWQPSTPTEPIELQIS